MNLEFYNCTPPQSFDAKLLPKDEPLFLNYQPSWSAMEALAEKYKGKKNVLIVGHGGSVTSFYAIYNALKYKAAKKAYFLWTVDPDYIAELKAALYPADTVVVAVTKSGETTTQLEALSQFFDYPVVVITATGSSMHAIAQKMGFDVLNHPNIGGRYTAFTEVGMFPALLCSFDADMLLRGARELYHQFGKDNLAWKAASVFYQLEARGIVDVLVPIYSHYLFASSNLLMQLCHESFGKDGKGQTYTACEAPEVQHHTVQRLLGGRKNMAAWFISLVNFASRAASSYPASMHSVPFRGRALFDINHIPLSVAMHAELTGTLEAARLRGVPSVRLELTGLEEQELGRFLSFLQLYAVYASVLRGVNPFDQPAVETGKEISLNARLQLKGLL